MSTILSLGLGQFKSVACLNDPDTQETRNSNVRFEHHKIY